MDLYGLDYLDLFVSCLCSTAPGRVKRGIVATPDKATSRTPHLSTIPSRKLCQLVAVAVHHCHRAAEIAMLKYVRRYLVQQPEYRLNLSRLMKEGFYKEPGTCLPQRPPPPPPRSSRRSDDVRDDGGADRGRSAALLVFVPQAAVAGARCRARAGLNALNRDVFPTRKRTRFRSSVVRSSGRASHPLIVLAGAAAKIGAAREYSRLDRLDDEQERSSSDRRLVRSLCQCR
jgi:hypothetical protein